MLMIEPSLEELNALQQRAYAALIRKDYAEAEQLYRTLYEHVPENAAPYLGFILADDTYPGHDRLRAESFLLLAAENDNVWAQYELGILLEKTSRLDEALAWYVRGSDLGDGDCSFSAYLLLRSIGRLSESNNYLQRAIQQDFAPARQRYAISMMKGEFGPMSIIKGLGLYFRNIPSLVRMDKSTRKMN